MIGDPLKQLMDKRRDARETHGTPEPPQPEGVTLYECRVLVWTDFGEDERGPIEAGIPCRHREERKPYAAKPWHHEAPMAIAGYDWNRDVD